MSHSRASNSRSILFCPPYAADLTAYPFISYWKKEVEILNQTTIIGWNQRDSTVFLFWGLFDRFTSPLLALTTCTIFE